MRDDQLLRYSRHIMLPEIDIDGQQALLQSHVLIIGAGGLGCPAALYLASSGTGTLSISDDDNVELGNLQRQIGHFTDDIGTPKTRSLQIKLKAINPDSQIHTLPRLNEKHMRKAVREADVVLECSDNFATRYLVNRACIAEKKPLVSGSVVGFTGQVGVFAPHKGSPCYQCLYPEMTDSRASCAESGVIAPAVGIIGAMQALEAIKLITRAGSTSIGQLSIFDGLTGHFKHFTISPDSHCTACKSPSA